MNSARILSTATLAAVAAFASVGAYAAPAAGEFSAVPNDADFQSVRTRAEVVVEAAQAVANFKNYYLESQDVQPPTVLTRAEVRAEGRLALRTHELATGNFS